jgi:TPR repeat protein
MMREIRFAMITSSSVFALGCGPGTAAEAVRAEAPSASQAVGDGPCGDVTAGGEPLVVDWKPEQRGNLEIAMKEGVAVVAYSCDKLELLGSCHIAGEYGYIGMTTREQVVRLESSDEVRANLPLSGATLGGELARGTTLEVAMILVGKRRTTWNEPTRADLAGDCDRATHYVSGATVGAFALDSGSQAKVRAAAEVFGAGASSGSTSGKQVMNRDGNPDDCKKATPDATVPPPQCGAPVRLVLAPIAKAPAADAPPPAPAQKVAAAEAACPAGLVLAEGKCTKPGGAAAFQCRAGDAAECSAQCEKGHGGSCASLGDIARDQGDFPRATAALKKSCDAGDARGCGALGELVAAGRRPPPDAAAAARLFEKSCSGGEARGCTDFGRALKAGAGVAANEARARSLAEQGCNGGDARGCGDAAEMAALGKGGSADAARAAALYAKACDGGQAASCKALGDLYDAGASGVGKNPVSAEIFYRRGCHRGSAESCVSAARAIVSRPTGDPANEAKWMFERGCIGRVALGCAALKVSYGDTRPVFADPAQKQELTKSCNAGKTSACTASGLLDLATGNAAMAKPTLQRACTQGDKWACQLAAKAGK